MRSYFWHLNIINGDVINGDAYKYEKVIQETGTSEYIPICEIS